MPVLPDCKYHMVVRTNDDDGDGNHDGGNHGSSDDNDDGSRDDNNDGKQYRIHTIMVPYHHRAKRGKIKINQYTVCESNDIIPTTIPSITVVP